MQSFIKYVAGAMAIAGIGASASAAWVDPIDGWQVNYEASSGNLPNQASPAWTRTGYQSTDPAGQAYSVIQEVGGEESLLLTNNGTTSPATGANYNLSSGAGAGTSADDLVTLDTRFQLTGAVAATQYQLQLIVTRPVYDDAGNQVTGQRQLYFLNLAQGRIGYSTVASASGSSYTKTDLLGNGWHALRWHIDVKTGEAYVYLDGSSEPLALTGLAAFVQTANGSLIQFGDASSAIFGEASLQYIRFTNNELAAVPEPTSLGLLAVGGLLMKRRRAR